MIRGSVSDKIVGSGTGKKSGLIVRRVGDRIGGTGYRASMVAVIAKGKWAYGDVVCQGVPHLVPVFQIYIGTADVIKHVTLHLCMVGSVNDDSSLLRILDGVILEETIGAFSHSVKMQTILSLNSCEKTLGICRQYYNRITIIKCIYKANRTDRRTSLATFFNANVFNLRHATKLLHRVQSNVALGAKG